MTLFVSPTLSFSGPRGLPPKERARRVIVHFAPAPTGGVADALAPTTTPPMVLAQFALPVSGQEKPPQPGRKPGIPPKERPRKS